MNENKTPDKISFHRFIQIVWWDLNIYLKIDKLNTIVSIGTYTILNLQYLINTFIYAKLIDQMFKSIVTNLKTINDIIPYLLILIGYEVFNNFIRMLNSYSSRVIDHKSRFLPNSLHYENLNYLGIATLEQPEINNRVQRANQNIYVLNQFLERIGDLIAGLITSILTGLTVLIIIPIFIPIVVLIALVQLIPNRKYIKEEFKFHFGQTEDRRKSDLTADILTHPKELQEVQSTNAYQFLNQKYLDFVNPYINRLIHIRKRWDQTWFVVSLLDIGAMLAAYIIVLNRLINKLISIGDVFLQTRSIQLFSDSISQFFNRIANTYEFSLRLNDTYELFHTKPIYPDGKIPFSKGTTPPTIQFDNVTFAYPNSQKNIISGFNLTINSGEKVAIVGPNGAGKTTLAKLIARIYQVNQGSLKINGTNINDLIISDWYENVGILFQDFNFYTHLTVKENIYIGRSNQPIDEDKIIQAAQRADAAKFIEQYPNKYDQILSERFTDGIRPSTGQIQKLAIARFFYRNAPLVIFDEPTASIDAESEFNIFNQIYDFFQDKTVIIISHRFSTVRNANRIIVLNDGAIVEQGSHERLMDLNGKYAHAFNLQAKGYQE